MRLMGAIVASCLMTLCASLADASVVNFQGKIDQGSSGGVLGPVSTIAPVYFTLQVVFPDATSPPNSTGVTGGTFDILSPAMNFLVDSSGSSITVKKGTPDSVRFIINVHNPTTSGTLDFTFKRDGVVGSPPNANQTTIDALVSGNSADFQATLGGVVYNGQITGVPEPSSCLALLGLVGGGVCRWRRKRQLQNAA